MSSEETGKLYSDVDSTSDPQALVEHMDKLRSLDPFREVKRRNFELLDIQPDGWYLDVGCGAGDDVRELAGSLGAGGRVIGVDSSETMISEAQRRSEGLNL